MLAQRAQVSLLRSFEIKIINKGHKMLHTRNSLLSLIHAVQADVKANYTIGLLNLYKLTVADGKEGRLELIFGNGYFQWDKVIFSFDSDEENISYEYETEKAVDEWLANKLPTIQEE